VQKSTDRAAQNKQHSTKSARKRKIRAMQQYPQHRRTDPHGTPLPVARVGGNQDSCKRVWSACKAHRGGLAVYGFFRCPLGSVTHDWVVIRLTWVNSLHFAVFFFFFKAILIKGERGRSRETKKKKKQPTATGRGRSKKKKKNVRAALQPKFIV